MERNTAFFKNVFQLETTFDGEKAKLPIFYYDGSFINGIFYAKMSMLKKFMPKRDYHPLPLAPGIGAIAVTCFTYLDSDIRPYNELAVSIPMSYKSRPVIPLAGIMAALLKNDYHIYIHHLPVTTKIALDAGVVIYNYPKILATIDYDDSGDDVRVNLEENGDTILKLTAEKIPAEKSRRIKYVTYPVKDDCAQHVNILLNANKYGHSFNPKRMKIELGETHEIACELKKALIGRRPVMYQYAPAFQMILYGPGRME